MSVSRCGVVVQEQNGIAISFENELLLFRPSHQNIHNDHLKLYWGLKRCSFTKRISHSTMRSSLTKQIIQGMSVVLSLLFYSVLTFVSTFHHRRQWKKCWLLLEVGTQMDCISIFTGNGQKEAGESSSRASIDKGPFHRGLSLILKKSSNLSLSQVTSW